MPNLTKVQGKLAISFNMALEYLAHFDSLRQARDGMTNRFQ